MLDRAGSTRLAGDAWSRASPRLSEKAQVLTGRPLQSREVALLCLKIDLASCSLWCEYFQHSNTAMTRLWSRSSLFPMSPAY